MTSEHKIILPDAPAPDAEVRQAAIATALAQFEQKNRAPHQGSDTDGHLMRQTAIPPSGRRSVMPRTRYAVAASLVILMAGFRKGLQVWPRQLAGVDDGQVGFAQAGGPTFLPGMELDVQRAGTVAALAADRGLGDLHAMDAPFEGLCLPRVADQAGFADGPVESPVIGVVVARRNAPGFPGRVPGHGRLDEEPIHHGGVGPRVPAGADHVAEGVIREDNFLGPLTPAPLPRGERGWG